MQIYADNAATTKPSKAAVRAMLSCLEQNYGNPSSLHHVGQAAAEALLQARQDIAGCLGCTLCAKSCPSGAIAMVNNLPRIDYSKCTGCLVCASKCPTKCIKVLDDSAGTDA